VARWHGGCNSRGTLSYKSSTIAAHTPPSIDPGSGQWRGDTENAKAEMLYYEGSTIAAHTPPSMTQGQVSREVTQRMKRKMLYYEGSTIAVTGHLP